LPFSARKRVDTSIIFSSLGAVQEHKEKMIEIESGLTNDRLRVLLKKTFFGHTAQLGAAFDKGSHFYKF
jgi:hypothetical protein